jgi:CRISPR-associated protein Cmr3
MTPDTAAEPIRLCLEPLDVLFFRDGRPFTAASHGKSGLPMPQTLAGAILTALLQRYGRSFDPTALKDNPPNGFEELVSRAQAPPWVGRVAVRGPWLARLDADGEPEVLLPAPAALRLDKKPQPAGHRRLHLLSPLSRHRQVPGWSPPAPGMRPLWLAQRDRTEAADGYYLTPEGLRRFLAGEIPGEQDLVVKDKLFGFDDRTGIGVEPDRLTAAESLLYSASFLALRAPYTARERHEEPRSVPQVVLYAEVAPPPEGVEAVRAAFRDAPPLPLGGEGRRVRVEPVLRSPWPEQTPAAGRQRPFLLLTTPGFFETAWRPQCLAGNLVAAAVPGSVAVSGWDLATGGAKPTRFAAAAGSVYFLDALPEHLPPDSLCDAAKDRQQGWGGYLQGVWTDD